MESGKHREILAWLEIYTHKVLSNLGSLPSLSQTHITFHQSLMVTVTYSVLETLSNCPSVVGFHWICLRIDLGTRDSELIQAELVLDACSGR